MLLNMLFTLLYHHLQMTKICQQLNTDKKQFHYWILHCDYWHRTSQAKRQKSAVNKIQKNFILWHQWYGKHLWAPAGLNSTTWGGIKHSNSSNPFQMKHKKKYVWAFYTPVNIKYILFLLNQKWPYRLFWQKSVQFMNGITETETSAFIKDTFMVTCITKIIL